MEKRALHVALASTLMAIWLKVEMGMDHSGPKWKSGVNKRAEVALASLAPPRDPPFKPPFGIRLSLSKFEFGHPGDWQSSVQHPASLKPRLNQCTEYVVRTRIASPGVPNGYK